MLKSEREAFADGRQCPVLPRAGQARLGDRSIYLRARNVSLANCVFACLALTAFAGADTPREVNVSDEATRAALQRSVGFLLKDQNPNGSWGSIANALPGYDDIFLNTETQRGWQVATTALACISLQHTTVTSEETWAAYDRGIDFCLPISLVARVTGTSTRSGDLSSACRASHFARMNQHKDSPRCEISRPATRCSPSLPSIRRRPAAGVITRVVRASRRIQAGPRVSQLHRAFLG